MDIVGWMVYLTSDCRRAQPNKCIEIKFCSAPWCFWDKTLDRRPINWDDRPVYIATDCHITFLNKVTLVILY